MKNSTFFYTLLGFFTISVPFWVDFNTTATISLIIGGLMILYIAVKEEYEPKEVEGEQDENNKI